MDFINRLTKHSVRRDMITPAMTPERIERKQNLSSTLLVSQIILSAEIQRYASQVRMYLEEHGILRQRAKVACRDLMESSIKLQADVEDAERKMILPNYTQCFPHYAANFANEGYSISKILQGSIYYGQLDQPQQLFLAYRRLVESQSVANAELVAYLYTVIALAYTGRQVADNLNELFLRVDGYLGDATAFHVPILNKIEHSAAVILSSIPQSKLNVEEDDKKEVSAICTAITKDLVGERAMELFIQSTEHLVYNFMEYCLACILLEDRAGGVSEGAWSWLVTSVGEEVAEAVLQELRKVTVDADADAIDVIDLIPDAEEGEPLRIYREAMIALMPRYVGALEVNNTEKNTLN